ncbi:MAG: ABC transporter permease subunit [Cyanobacteria bacterium J06626_18]
MAKPVSRLEFIIGKHLGLSAVLAVLMVLLTAIYLAVLAINQIAFAWASLLLAVPFPQR